MRYTANGSKFFWYFWLPFLLCFYIAFLFLEHNYFYNNNSYEIAKKKAASLQSIDDLNGIILGGSNAFYGLSASSLSQLSGQQWFNLALIAEGYSDENYWDFVAKSLTNEQRLNISHVIYSSATPVSGGIRESSSLDLGGKQKLSFRPQYSLASYIKRLLIPPLLHPMPDNFGDFRFDSYDCDYVVAEGILSFNYLTEVDLIWWITKQVNHIQSMFPNAKILLQVPNALHADGFNYAELDEVLAILSAVLQKNQQDWKTLIYHSAQDPYPAVNLMCNDSWHANKFGRDWRTTAISSISDFWGS